MLINEEQLKLEIMDILKTKTRNKIVQEIKATGDRFHFFQLNNFLDGKDVSLSTLKKIDEFVNK